MVFSSFHLRIHVNPLIVDFSPLFCWRNFSHTLYIIWTSSLTLLFFFLRQDKRSVEVKEKKSESVNKKKELLLARNFKIRNIGELWRAFTTENNSEFFWRQKFLASSSGWVRKIVISFGEIHWLSDVRVVISWRDGLCYVDLWTGHWLCREDIRYVALLERERVYVSLESL